MMVAGARHRRLDHHLGAGGGDLHQHLDHHLGLDELSPAGRFHQKKSWETPKVCYR